MPGWEAYYPAWQLRDDNDIQFIALSYDVGHEKPDRRIFDAAKEVVSAKQDLDCQYIHIGDDLNKDALGASAAGWRGLVLDRGYLHEAKGLPAMKSLAEVGEILWKQMAQGGRSSISNNPRFTG